jgi:hypothetical protein
MKITRVLISCTIALLSNAATFAQAKDATRVYAEAKPYKDDPLPLLKMKIKELDGLKAETSQVDLTTVLDKVGEVIVAQMPRVPNLIAQEDVAQEQPTPPVGLSAGSLNANARMQMDRITQAANTQDQALVPQNWKRFEYVVLAEPQSGGGILFNESRKDLNKGHHAAGPRGIGFGSLWLMFVPSNIGESHFRYLGTQNVNKRPTFVVAFSQDPALVKMPGVIETDNGQMPLLYQGVAWIDQESYRIVRIRTDLLSPLPHIKLLQATSTVDFSAVVIPKFTETLWLPKSVELTWDLNGNRLGELHRYSKYQLFAATSRIVPN